MKLILENNSLALSDWPHFCDDLLSKIEKPYLLLLNGDLAAGKTTFVKYWLEAVLRGNKDKDLKKNNNVQVSSPTYSLHQMYSLPNDIIHHFDLYRIEDESELETIGFWELFYQNHSILIEWPSKLNWDQIKTSKKVYEINFKVRNEHTRSIQVFMRH